MDGSTVTPILMKLIENTFLDLCFMYDLTSILLSSLHFLTS